MSDERGVVRDVVVRWKDGDRSPRRHRDEAEQTVENGGSSAPILRLNHHASGREVGQERSIEAFVRANDDCEGAVRRNEQRGAPQGLLQKRLVAQHRAELLGPFVPDDSARQWAKPRAVSAGENESPGRRRVRL